MRAWHEMPGLDAHMTPVDGGVMFSCAHHDERGKVYEGVLAATLTRDYAIGLARALLAAVDYTPHPERLDMGGI